MEIRVQPAELERIHAARGDIPLGAWLKALARMAAAECEKHDGQCTLRVVAVPLESPEPIPA